MKQYSQACDENREPILKLIRKVFANAHSILEIGSGTGQHAVYFARQLPHLTWQPTDLEENHASIQAWRDESGLENVRPPIALDVSASAWPDSIYDGFFSANTAHIMNPEEVQRMFSGIGNLLPTGAHCCLYGPFNYDGAFTSDSNKQFDSWLKKRNPASGIRYFEVFSELGDAKGFILMGDNEMRVNYRLIVWNNC
jgi:cyclopropane fatty-acyl-phospholipid synthase-like methyltransferase